LRLRIGVNTTSKNILFAPGQFASGIWIGVEGARILQVDADAAIVASGKITYVDSDLGYLTVDFTPAAASSTTSHRICFEGMEQAKEAVGVNEIIANTGTSLWNFCCILLVVARFRFGSWI